MEINEFINSGEEPLPDSHYGDGYRCSAYLKDGLYLPCVVIRRNDKYIDLACRRLQDEKSGKSIFKNKKSGFRETVKTFVTSGNKINAHDIKSVEPSKYAFPDFLLKQVEGETVMSYTSFVLEMQDGKRFSYGSSFLFAFFDLPSGYAFSDVSQIHNHSFVSQDGLIVSVKGVEDFKGQYLPATVYRERPYFECYVE